MPIAFGQRPTPCQSARVYYHLDCSTVCQALRRGKCDARRAWFSRHPKLHKSAYRQAGTCTMGPSHPALCPAVGSRTAAFAAPRSNTWSSRLLPARREGHKQTSAPSQHIVLTRTLSGMHIGLLILQSFDRHAPGRSQGSAGSRRFACVTSLLTAAGLLTGSLVRGASSRGTGRSLCGGSVWNSGRATGRLRRRC